MRGEVHVVLDALRKQVVHVALVAIHKQVVHVALAVFRMPIDL